MGVFQVARAEAFFAFNFCSTVFSSLRCLSHMGGTTVQWCFQRCFFKSWDAKELSGSWTMSPSSSTLAPRVACYQSATVFRGGEYLGGVRVRARSPNHLLSSFTESFKQSDLLLESSFHQHHSGECLQLSDDRYTHGPPIRPLEHDRWGS